MLCLPLVQAGLRKRWSPALKHAVTNGLLPPQTPRAARVFGLLAVAWLGAAYAYGENGHGRWTAEAQEGAETKEGSIVSANADPPPKPLPTCGECCPEVETGRRC